MLISTWNKLLVNALADLVFLPYRLFNVLKLLFRSIAYDIHHIPDKNRKFVDFSVEFVSILLIAIHQFNSDQGCQVS